MPTLSMWSTRSVSTTSVTRKTTNQAQPTATKAEETKVLRMIRDNTWPIVALLEFEHGTLRTQVDEVQRMFDYCKRAVG